MNKNLKKCFLLYFLALAVFTACKKGGSNQEPVISKTKADTDVYVCGNTSPTHDTASIAIYWKNGVETLLTGASFSYASAIATNGSDIYIAGLTAAYYTAPKSKAVYWKNGIINELTDGTTSAAATDVAISGNDVYVSGNINKAAVCWKNGVVSTLTDNTVTAGANGIFVSGTDVYVCGAIFTHNALVPVYWKNGVMTKLNEGTPYTYASASAIAVQNNIVYVAYSYLTPGQSYYWENGAINQLSGGLYSSATTKMIVNGTDSYITGYASSANGQNIAAYWKNSILQILSANPAADYTNGIAVLGNNVYVAGRYQNSGSVYWKNGTAVKLGDTSTGVTGIVVIPGPPN